MKFEGKFINDKRQQFDWWFEAPSVEALQDYLKNKGWQIIELRSETKYLIGGKKGVYKSARRLATRTIQLQLALLIYEAIFCGIYLTYGFVEGWNDQEIQIPKLDFFYFSTGILFWVVADIVFLVWFRRVYSNLFILRVSDSDLDYTPNMAVASFFIPILNLFAPYQIMKEIWKGSDPAIDFSHPSSWKKAPSSPLIGWWWILSIVGGVLGRLLLPYNWTEPRKTTEGLWVSVGALAAFVTFVVSTVFLVRIIREIDRRQEAKRSLISMEEPSRKPVESLVV